MFSFGTFLGPTLIPSLESKCTDPKFKHNTRAELFFHLASQMCYPQEVSSCCCPAAWWISARGALIAHVNTHRWSEPILEQLTLELDKDWFCSALWQNTSEHFCTDPLTLQLHADTPKNETSVIFYSPLCRSKPMPFFCLDAKYSFCPYNERQWGSVQFAWSGFTIICCLVAAELYPILVSY